MSLEAHPHPRALGPLWLLMATQAFISPGPSPADVWCHLSEKNPEGVNLYPRGLSPINQYYSSVHTGPAFPLLQFPGNRRALLLHTIGRITVVLATRTDLPLAYLPLPVYYVTA